ncbi:hypothetical protein B7494_g5109 [Chlorociboria aeruginascens]|nr:hypothetical protein B7494_g5109 [Chlorociboria aeruginascens]
MPLIFHINLQKYLANPPNTGVIRSYDFTISKGVISPDGYQKEALLINGQFPGPLIEANWWMDGVPGVHQCPIAPGKSFTYSFFADLYGTSWYHSHYSAQYAAGLFGPMIIHGPDTLLYDIDIGPVLLTDYFHRDYLSIVADVVGTDIKTAVPLSDNNLINGFGTFDCTTLVNDTTPCTTTTALPTFKLTPGAIHRFRLINAGAEGVQKFSVDGHTLTVIANDFVPIIPYTTEVVTLGVGQRTDVLVYSPLIPLQESYYVRSYIPITGCSSSNKPDAVGIAYYGLEPTTPSTTVWPALAESLTECANDNLTETVPWFPQTSDPTPSTVQTIDIEFGQNSSGNWLWTMNAISFRANYNNPVLLLSNLGNNTYPDDEQWNVYDFGSNHSIRIVLTNPVPVPHPIHLHGHNMFVLAAGVGTWDGTSVTRPLNPQRRDVQILPGSGYLVLQIDADNPGIWPLHCHIAWHVSGGLYMNVMERPADIAGLQIPSVVAQTCRDWAAFTNVTVVDQIDSGLKLFNEEIEGESERRVSESDGRWKMWERIMNIEDHESIDQGFFHLIPNYLPTYLSLPTLAWSELPSLELYLALKGLRSINEMDFTYDLKSITAQSFRIDHFHVTKPNSKQISITTRTIDITTPHYHTY